MRHTTRRAIRFPVFLGSLAALLAGAARDVSAANALLTIQGAAAGDEFGSCVAVAGDTDGDGVLDVIVGSGAGGYALIISGAKGSTLQTLKGSSTTQFGASVAGVGDLDGDGYDDVIVGAPKEGKQQEGAAHVYSGIDGSLLFDVYGDSAGDALGCSVGAAGDVDGDGIGDFIVGARFATDPSVKGSPAPGMVKVLSGKDGSQIYALYGDANGDEFGVSVCGAGGDQDGDGVDDFAVGAQFALDAKAHPTGMVRIFSGASGKAIADTFGDRDYDTFGFALCLAGDIDGDGLPEFVVGAPSGSDTSGTKTGYVRLISSGLFKSMATMYGDADGDLLGCAVSGGEDVDGDGLPDVAAGARGMTNKSGKAAGGIRVYSGADQSEIATHFGEAADDRFGAAVALIPDVTADKAADVIAGIPYDDGAGTDAGSAILVGPPLPTGPSGTVVIDDGAQFASSLDVTLSFAWTNGDAEVSQMRYRTAGGSWSGWTAVAETASWSLDPGDGPKSVEAQFRDAGGLDSDVASDSIVLDATAPGGSVSINSGAVWSNSASVTLGLTYSDAGSGVAKVRLRNQGDAFGAWAPVTSTAAWTLAGGNGTRTVEAQFQDTAGNVSDVVSDAVSVDLDAPTGTIVIAGGADLVKTRTVSIAFTAKDTGGSGVTEMRLRRSDAAGWDAWRPFAASLPYALAGGDGPQDVNVQFRDVAGNESATYTDTVTLDESAPTITSFAVHDPQAYYMPLATIGFDLVAADAKGGTGLDAARTTWDNGAHWTAWTDISGGGVYTPARPTLSGLVSVSVVVRDKAGNESERSASVALFFVDPQPQDLASGGKRTGGMAGADDVDVVGIDLVRGDILSVTLKAKAGVKKQPFALALDLARPDGESLVTAKYPTNLKTAGIKSFIAPATGRYLLIVRHADAAGSPTGTYSLAMKVKHAKANAGGKETTSDGSFSFDAAAGSTFSATLSGAGLDAAGVTLEGPDGPVSVTAKVKGKSVAVGPVKLPAATGTYTLRFTATGPVTYSWKSVLPKANVKLAE